MNIVISHSDNGTFAVCVKFFFLRAHCFGKCAIYKSKIGKNLYVYIVLLYIIFGCKWAKREIRRDRRHADRKLCVDVTYSVTMLACVKMKKIVCVRVSFEWGDALRASIK